MTICSAELFEVVLAGLIVSVPRSVSTSGRVAIDAEDWNLAFATVVRRQSTPNLPPLEDGYGVTWKSRFLGARREAS